MALNSGDMIQPPASTPTPCLHCSCSLVFYLHFAVILGPSFQVFNIWTLLYFILESCKTAANRKVHCV